jgi:uncharacterized membrane protein
VYAEAGGKRSILPTECNDQVLHLRRHAKRRHGFLRILRLAADGSYALGRTATAAAVAGTTVWWRHESELRRSFGLPAGAHHRHFFLWRDPYKYDPFVRFHAFQSIFLSLSYGVFFAGMNMFVSLLVDMKLGFVFSVLGPLMALARWACILLGLFTMYKAFKFERFSLPIIGRMAAALAGEG